MKKFGLAILAFAALTSSSSASDLPTKAPAYNAPVAAPVYNWTGFYIGINGGGGWGRESWLDNGGGNPADYSPSGGIFGGQLGFRWQMNQFVFGIEGAGDWADLKSTISGGEPVTTETFKVKSLYAVTGQLGWAIDRWLLYVKGGWAGASTSVFWNDPGSVVTASGSQTANGWTFGGGIDYAVWQNWIIGVEYDHFDLNYGTYSLPVSNGSTPFIVTNTSRLTIDQVVARLSYKFWTP